MRIPRTSVILAVVSLFTLSLACGTSDSAAIPATPPPALVMKVWVERDMAFAGDPQTVHVKVLDPQGRPVPGATVLGMEQMEDGRQQGMLFADTDAEGLTRWQGQTPEVGELHLVLVHLIAIQDAGRGEAFISYVVRP